MADGTSSSFTILGGDGSIPAVGPDSPPPGNFRGFLIRAEVPEDGISDWAIELTDTNAQPAAVCVSTATANIVGITHNSNVDKTSANGFLTLDGADAGTTGTIDVTVVIENGAGVSVYYYAGYTLEVVAGAAPVDPTEAPVDPADPTDAPVAPTEAPVGPTDPTDAPVDPTEAPVGPTEAPVDPPTDPPSAASMVTASSSAAVVVAIAASAMMM
eukprot:CAMPEP_0113454118 /NCGR_PEP_ID=MMETSP0014_2-20120614/7701_1 /TAXON_ID=2857 /ORGANISM="Nitzschia sp." /LENGTH=213 /DNA_ID=CAMNT_0000345519 /DNA_START=380 /DNA_END=1021 /DNA_ORIENTATION=- /assembly_acc=CAM_ASM_000159